MIIPIFTSNALSEDLFRASLTGRSGTDIRKSARGKHLADVADAAENSADKKLRRGQS
jgi:hypothetical protein